MKDSLDVNHRQIGEIKDNITMIENNILSSKECTNKLTTLTSIQEIDKVSIKTFEERVKIL